MRLNMGLLLIAALIPFTAMGQTQAPPWPDISFSTCPAIAVPIASGQLMWKHGPEEQMEFEAALKPKDQMEGAAALVGFAERYPDSDYREPAVILAMAVYEAVKDAGAEIRLAKKLIDFPTAQAATRVVGYATLANTLSAYVTATDSEKARKIADLEKWTRCGMEALRAEVRPDNMQPDTFEKNREASEFVFDRTLGYVAFLRGDYDAAILALERATQLRPTDGATFLWLGGAKLVSTTPDLNGGVFNIARYVGLAPQDSGASDLLKQVYVIIHGSEKGLDKIKAVARTNATLPAGFTVLAPPKKEHHFATAIATAAIVGLLIFGEVKLAQSGAGGAVVESLSGESGPGSSKLVIFGGLGHRTYLGCLSCSESAPDSVFNAVGLHGSRVATDSIWNSVGQYGSSVSPYSACNPVATDPPVMVDANGTAYGRLTVNTTSPEIGMGARFENWLSFAVCQR